MSIYSKIHDLCSIKNSKMAHQQGLYYSPRLQFILDLIKSEGIEYYVDDFQIRDENNKGFNIVMRGSAESKKMVIAHHDIVNGASDNANDNSASVINAIALKKLRPEIHVVITDGEEIGGYGAKHLAQQINKGVFEVEYVLNLELTGKGGTHFFYGNYKTPLANMIQEKFPDCVPFRVPFNDSVILLEHGINTTVITTLDYIDEPSSVPLDYKDGFLKTDILFNCHTEDDSLDTIDTADMELFVNEVLLKILD